MPKSKDSTREKCSNELGIIDLFHSPEQLRVLRNARGTAFFHRAVSVLRSAGYEKEEAARAARRINLNPKNSSKV
jgi:hypothetical protein